MADRLHDLATMLAIPGLPSWVGFILLLAIVVSALSLLAMQAPLRLRWSLLRAAASRCHVSPPA